MENWLHDYGWHGRHLLTQPVWLGFSAFWGLLLLLLARRQWRRSRAASLAARPGRTPGRQRPPLSDARILPGQRELERVRVGKIVDEVAGQLHLAYAYIETGESDKAARLLDEVIRKGNARQVERARELKRQLG